MAGDQGFDHSARDFGVSRDQRDDAEGVIERPVSAIRQLAFGEIGLRGNGSDDRFDQARFVDRLTDRQVRHQEFGGLTRAELYVFVAVLDQEVSCGG